LSEGGMGLSSIRARPPVDGLRLEFQLPGESAPLRVESQVAWTRPEGTAFRAGMRFTAMDDTARSSIRRYVDARSR
ncbi:MAG TPA: PilZ domain-containing protein, partial [bacterium]|nr:PilZ domain-containing protein [bacterium]